MHLRAFVGLFPWYYCAMKPRPYRSVSPSTVLLMRQIIVGLMIVAFFGMLIVSVWYGSRVNAFTLTEVAISGGETIDHSEIERAVREQISGSYLKIVPRAFAFTYPHEDIIAVVAAVPRVKDVKVVRVGGTELRIEFSEYEAQALWCAQEDINNCYFLDERGYAFTKAPGLVGGSFLRVVAIGKQPQEHVAPFGFDEYTRVIELKDKFAEAKWFVKRADIDTAGDAFLTIVDGGEFKVSLKQPADETVSNLLTVLGSEQFAHIEPGNFEYVDLRFGSKVFVNEVTTEVSASTTASSTSPTTPVEQAPPAAVASDPAIASEETIAEALAEGASSTSE
jgi:cell division septal protein FtsQ